MKTKTQKIVMASLMSALCCVVTMLVKVPSPLKGYLNLGDGIVLLSGWMFSPWYAFLTAGIGSSLADFFSGYGVYIPATFVIKGLMALIFCMVHRFLQKKLKNFPSLIISGIISEIVMVSGYFIFEGFLYGFIASVVNIYANAVQGAAGLILGVILINIFRKNKIKF